MEMNVEIEGLEDVIRGLELMPELMGPVYGAATFAMAEVVADTAIATGAFQDQTGRLRRSIKPRRQSSVIQTNRGPRRKSGTGAQVHAGSAGARQAHLVEAGHGGPQPARAHPFLVPALIGTRSRQLSAMAAAARRRFAALRVGAAGRALGL